ncbi:MAG: 4-hydroxy-tetrahydrodipicolinate reductase [Victivallales bacterium]|nr:4-hydroxy-tetrahydrodipicolinate reductase [Victivallales bacterium]
MIKISVIGASGKMGKLIVKNTLQTEGFVLAGAVENGDCPDIDKDAGSNAGLNETGIKITGNIESTIDNTDVFIDFSTGPVVKNAEFITEKNKSIVIGTTGLTAEEKEKLTELPERNKGKIVFAPNMSSGVNLLFYLTELASKILNKNYETEIVEMHHNLKKDAPSGTALKLAEVISDTRDIDLDKYARYGRKGKTGPRENDEIGIHVLRGGDVVGEHTVIFATEGERFELTHKASNKEAFVKGALEAARFIIDAAPGIYDMQDVLGIK